MNIRRFFVAWAIIGSLALLSVSCGSNSTPTTCVSAGSSSAGSRQIAVQCATNPALAMCANTVSNRAACASSMPALGAASTAPNAGGSSAWCVTLIGIITVTAGSVAATGTAANCGTPPISSPPQMQQCSTPLPGTVPYLLPTNFQVYTGPGYVVADCPFTGSAETTLPTLNTYIGNDGGYMAVYTHTANCSAYPISNGIYVAGQIRLEGTYQGGIFQPQGYTTQALSAMMNQDYPACNGDTWAGGDTGGWFGLQ